MNRTWMVGLVVALAVAGCDDRDTPHTRTVVSFGADGTATTQIELTDSDDPYDVGTWMDAGPTFLPPPGHLSCDDGHALHLYDQPNRKGNELCFIGHGDAELRLYPRVVCSGNLPPPQGCHTETWERAVRSYTTGGQYGYLIDMQSDGLGHRAPMHSESFLPKQTFPFASATAQLANAVLLRDSGECLRNRCPATPMCGAIDDGCGGQLCCTSACPGQLCQPGEP